MEFDNNLLDEAFRILEGRLHLRETTPVRLVICGGSALIAAGLVCRTTDDVDVVALADKNETLVSPVPFPDYLSEAAGEVAVALNLSNRWLNNGPSSDSGGLFQTGLPEGLLTRAKRIDFGTYLSVYYIGRIDQIFFKVFAAADSMGVHVDDLVALEPSEEEIENAARWCMERDPSEGFRMTLVSMFEQLGYENVAGRL